MKKLAYMVLSVSDLKEALMAAQLDASRRGKVGAIDGRIHTVVFNLELVTDSLDRTQISSSSFYSECERIIRGD
jgi:hypothetical protein